MPHTDEENLSEINFDSSVNLGRINERHRNHSGKGPRGWTFSDERIKEEVSMALFIDHIVDASDIEVDVEDGIVYLRGTVLDRAMKTAAERSVDRLTGVKDVMNELRFLN